MRDPAPSITAAMDALAADFAFLTDWEDRYAHVIDLGRAMPALPAEARTEEARVRGCASQVWLHAFPEGGLLRFAGDSDAHIVRGLIAILLQVYSHRTPKEILSVDAAGLMARLGLDGALSAQRANGLRAMVDRIRAIAAAAAPQASA